MTNREAIKIISNYEVNGCGYCHQGGNEVADAFNLAISALEKCQWTPVSDRLPEKDGDYLVTFEKGFAEDYGLDPIGIAPFDVDCEGFGIWDERFDKMTLGSLGSDWYELKVTAWMPLPEPFVEEQDG